MARSSDGSFFLFICNVSFLGTFPNLFPIATRFQYFDFSESQNYGMVECFAYEARSQLEVFALVV